MAAKSRMEKYRYQIIDLIKRGASIRSSWAIINSNLPDVQKTLTFEHRFQKHLNSVYTFIWTLFTVITWTLF